MPSLTVVGLGGPIARVSRSRAALLRALEGGKAAGADTRMLDLRELDLPMYNPDESEPTEPAATLNEACYYLLGREVVRVASKFADDATLHRQAESARAAERIAAA